MATTVQAVGPMMRLMMAGIGDLSKQFYRNYGDETLPMITSTAQRGGVEFGHIMQQMTPVHDVKSIVESMKMMDSMMEMHMDVVEASDTTFHFKVSKCPLGIEGTSRGLCEALMMNDLEMMRTFLGKDVDMQILKTVAVGDSECEVVYTIKSR